MSCIKKINIYIRQKNIDQVLLNDVKAKPRKSMK